MARPGHAVGGCWGHGRWGGRRTLSELGRVVVEQVAGAPAHASENRLREAVLGCFAPPLHPRQLTSMPKIKHHARLCRACRTLGRAVTRPAPTPHAPPDPSGRCWWGGRAGKRAARSAGGVAVYHA